MKDTTISRRSLLAATGACAATATAIGRADAAQPRSKARKIMSTDEVSNRILGFINSKGLVHFGDNPSKLRPTGISFEPENICVVHIKQLGSLRKEMNTAHFKYKSPDPDKRLSKAIDALIEKGKNNRFKDNSTHKPHKIAFTHPERYADSTDVGYFGFGSQSDIYFFIEHGSDLSFDTKYKNYFIFSKTSLNGDEFAENKSFYGAEKIDPNKLPPELNARGSMLRLENLFLDKNGRPRQSPSNELYLYKMSIVYLDAHGLPVLWDPTTGNGMGNEP